MVPGWIIRAVSALRVSTVGSKGRQEEQVLLEVDEC